MIYKKNYSATWKKLSYSATWMKSESKTSLSSQMSRQRWTFGPIFSSYKWGFSFPFTIDETFHFYKWDFSFPFPTTRTSNSSTRASHYIAGFCSGLRFHNTTCTYLEIPLNWKELFIILHLNCKELFIILHYLKVWHCLLDSTPELVQKLAIVALCWMLDNVVHQVEQHQLLLYPHL